MKIRGPEVGYVDLLNYETTEHLKKEQAEGRHYQKSPLRPSAAGKCTRELYYEMMQYSGKARYATEIHKPEVHRLLNFGHTVESHIIRQIEQHLKMVNVRYKQQTLSFYRLEAKNDPKLSQWLEGSLDLCVWSEQWKCVIDIKSKKDRFSSHRSSKWDEESQKFSRMRSVYPMTDTSFWVEDLEAFVEELNDPFFTANFLQLNLYLNSDFLKERGVDHGAIIQYSKNDSRLREVRFAPSQALFDQVRTKFQTVIRAVDEDNEKLAVKDHAFGSMKCAFCSFKAECWNEDALKGWYKTLPAKAWPKDTHRLGRLGDTLEELFQEYQKTDAVLSERDRKEAAIIKLCTDNEIQKQKLGNGDVYELKYLKSPSPHFELRRSKA
jgi:hypothetical protein